MAHSHKFSLKRMFALIFVIAAVMALLRLGLLYSVGRLEYPGWTSISIGDSRQQVLELMGDPDDTSEVFRLGQRHGYEDKYEEAHQANAKIWYRYHSAIDWTMAVGFDDTDRVVYKAEGGT